MDSSGGVLRGAQISIEAQSISTATDVQGQFFINDLDPGSYTLTITYVGFATFTKAVEVTAGQSVNMDATLGLQSENLQILVQAERPSAEAEAVNVERTADNIVQVLPAEVIRSLPNANMADALGRLPSITIERDEEKANTASPRHRASSHQHHDRWHGRSIAGIRSSPNQIGFDPR
jgi:hypothetical protein